ncbi:MAG TPA: S9 family peptidase, partial [Edaphobacter sp.]
MALGAAISLSAHAQVAQQSEIVKPGENLVLENIPPIPAAIAEQTARYGESRAATLWSWHPVKREMLIGTRFADVPQVHWVKEPGGARTQMTFYPDRILGAQFSPKDGASFVFLKDTGGGEWYQIYRFDIASGEITLLTDGKSRNGFPVFAQHENRIAYSSTRRNQKDTDIWLMDINDPKSEHSLLQVQGGGWSPAGWSLDNRQLLVEEEISVSESNVWLVDTATGDKKLLTPPQQKGTTVSYSDPRFSRDGKGVYLTTDRDSEFHRLAYLDLATRQPNYLTTAIPWDVEEFALSEDGKSIA